MKNILVVVDMQNDFIDGALGTKEALAIVPLVEKRLREHNGEIIFTRDTHSEEYLSTEEGRNLPVVHCVKGTFGWQICDALLPFVKDNVIDKPSFGSPELAKMIAKIAEKEGAAVSLVGLCTDICVISNAMLIKAFAPEIKITVEERLCAGVTPESHKNALSAMKMCQISVI